MLIDLTRRQLQLLHQIQKMSWEIDAPVPIRDIHLEGAGEATVREILAVLERKEVIRFIPGRFGQGKKVKVINWEK